MHPELTAALAPILTDLAVPSGVEATVSEQEWQDHPDSASCFLSGPDGFGTGVWICLGQPPTAQVAMLADQVQEWAVEALWQLGRSASWPACPYHPDRHPLAVRQGRGQALWSCPVQGREVSAVGALADAEVRKRQVRQARAAHGGGRPTST